MNKKNVVDAQLQIREAIKTLSAERSSREIAVALTHLETAQLWLLKAHIEARKETEQKPTPDIVIQDPCSVPPLSDMPWWERALFGCF